MNEETKKHNQAIEELILELTVIKSSNGEDVKLPILFKGHTLQLNKYYNELVLDPAKETLFNIMNTDDETKVDTLFKMMAIYTGKPVEWVEVNFTIEDTVGELQRFFGIVRYARATRKMQEFQKKVSLLIPSGN